MTDLRRCIERKKKKSRKRKKKKRKRFGLSKRGRAIEAKLDGIVNREIQEHKKLPPEQVNLFLAKLALEIDPTIEIPEALKEQAMETDVLEFLTDDETDTDDDDDDDEDAVNGKMVEGKSKMDGGKGKINGGKSKMDGGKSKIDGGKSKISGKSVVLKIATEKTKGKAKSAKQSKISKGKAKTAPKGKGNN